MSLHVPSGVSKVSGRLRASFRAAGVIATTFLCLARDLKSPEKPSLEPKS